MYKKLSQDVKSDNFCFYKVGRSITMKMTQYWKNLPIVSDNYENMITMKMTQYWKNLPIVKQILYRFLGFTNIICRHLIFGSKESFPFPE